MLPSILPTEQSTSTFNAAYTQAHTTSPAHILGAARGLAEELAQPGQAPVALAPEAKAQVEALVFQLLKNEVKPDIAVLTRAEAFLRDGLGLDVTKFRAGVKERLPLAWGFAAVGDREARAKQWADEDKKEKEAEGIH